MAYDCIPKTSEEMRKATKAAKMKPGVAQDAIVLFTCLVEKFPTVPDPIAIDVKNKTTIKIIRELKGEVTIAQMKKDCEITDLKLNAQSWGNGSRGGGGKFNQGSKFERDMTKIIDEWIQSSELPSDQKYADLITNIIIDHGLDDCKAIEVQQVGEIDTKRPLRWKAGWFVGTAGKGKFDIGKKVSDVTLRLKCLDNSWREVYLSLKTSGTVALSNLGTKTNVFPVEEIKAGKIKKIAGKKLLETFGIDHDRFCAVFNEAHAAHEEGQASPKIKLKAQGGNGGHEKVMPSKDLLESLIRGCLGYGYHYCHLHGGKIKEFHVTEDINKRTASTGMIDIYYGGKTGTGQRIDMFVTTPTMELKFNIRDTSGKGEGYPDKFQAGYKFKDETQWSLDPDDEYDE